MSSFANASSVAPAEFPICSTASFNFVALSHSTVAAFPASADPNIFPIVVPDSYACSSRIDRTSVRLHPCSIASAIVKPPSLICSVPSANALAAAVPCFPNSFNMEFIYVVDSAVAIPFDVITAYIPARFSIETPFAFAVGITFPIEAAN